MKMLTKNEGTVVIHKLIESDDLTIAMLYVKPEDKPEKKESFLSTHTGVVFVSALVLDCLIGLTTQGRFEILNWLCGCLTFVALLMGAVNGVAETFKDTSSETVYDTTWIKDKIDHVFKEIGFTTSAWNLIKKGSAPTIAGSIRDLLNFAYRIGYKDKVQNLVDQSDLPILAKGLAKSWQMSVTKSDSVKQVQKEYDKRIKAFNDDLYTLCEPKLKQLLFKLLEHERYNYLPEDLRYNLTNQYNERLLKDIKENG